MRIVKKNNVIKYKYNKDVLSEGVKFSILFYILSISIYILSIIIAIICLGDAPSIVGGLGLTSLICCFGSMAFSISELYFYGSYKKVTRNMLFLQILFLLFWIFYM